MQIPAALRIAIEREASLPPSIINSAASELSCRYRQGEAPAEMSHAAALAYALTRMPATYAADIFVLTEGPSSKSILDLGSGPATASWAACACWTGLEQITLIERDPQLLELGQRLASETGPAPLRNAQWLRQDLVQNRSFPEHGCVILSYSLGELNASDRQNLIDRAWAASQESLIVIEPGTPRGFSNIRTLRDHLITMGAHIAAPCPHDQACPIPKDDWCHFAARVERTAWHRRLKGADLSYEDEKFSYFIATRNAPQHRPDRIIRRPQKDPGLIHLALCTGSGLAEKQIRKKDGDAWRAARKTAWGDPWPDPPKLI